MGRGQSREPNPDELTALRQKGKVPARPAPPDDAAQGYRAGVPLTVHLRGLRDRGSLGGAAPRSQEPSMTFATPLALLALLLVPLTVLALLLARRRQIRYAIR